MAHSEAERKASMIKAKVDPETLRKTIVKQLRMLHEANAEYQRADTLYRQEQRRWMETGEAPSLHDDLITVGRFYFTKRQYETVKEVYEHNIGVYYYTQSGEQPACLVPPESPGETKDG